MHKIELNLGDNRQCDTEVNKSCKETVYDEVWVGEEGDLCKKCKDKEYLWRSNTQ